MTASKDHDLLVRMDENVIQILSEAKRTNGRITKVEGHQAKHCQEIAIINTQMEERTKFGWPSSKKNLLGGGTFLVAFGSFVAVVVGKLIEMWPF